MTVLYLIDFLKEKKEIVELLTGLDINVIDEAFRSKNNRAKKLLILLPKLISLKETYQVMLQSRKISLKQLVSQLNLGVLKPELSYSNEESILNPVIYYKPRSLMNLASKKVNQIISEIEIPVIRMEINKKTFFLIKEEAFKSLEDKIANSLKLLRIKPVDLRKIVESGQFKITQLKVYVGEEIGGAKGITNLTITGTDVIRGEDEFFRRYKTKAVIFHRLGAIIEAEISNMIKISINGKIYFETFRGVLIYFRYLAEKLYNI